MSKNWNPLILVMISLFIQISVNFAMWKISSFVFLQYYVWIIGACYGLTSSLFVISLCYFNKDFKLQDDRLAELYAFGYICAPVIGTLLFTWLSGYFYDQFGIDISNNICLGVECYNKSYLMWWVIESVALIITICFNIKNCIKIR